MQRGKAVKHLRECRLKRHQSGGKIHGFLLRANIENAYYTLNNSRCRQAAT
jgi:hypothetical protein